MDLRLEETAAPGARFVGDLPTYAFRRRRYWIDEPVATTVTAGYADTDVVPAAVTPDALAKRDVEEFLLDELAGVLRAEDDLDAAQTFLDVGGDSFTAMLFTKNIEQHYQVAVPLEEFVAELPLSALIGRLAAYIVDARSPLRERERTA